MSTFSKHEALVLRGLMKIVTTNNAKTERLYGKLIEITKKYKDEIDALEADSDCAKKSAETFSGKSFQEVVALLEGTVATKDEIKPASTTIVDPIAGEIISEVEPNITPEEVLETPEIEVPLVLSEEQQAFESGAQVKEIKDDGKINFFKEN